MTLNSDRDCLLSWTSSHFLMISTRQKRQVYHIVFLIILSNDGLKQSWFWKQMFKGKFINLVDLVDTENTGKCAAQFNTLNELKEYMIITEKFFLKESAYVREMLKFLLHKIINSHVSETSRWKHHWCQHIFKIAHYWKGLICCELKLLTWFIMIVSIIDHNKQDFIKSFRCCLN